MKQETGDIKRASSVSDWEGYYESRGEPDRYQPTDITDFRNLPHKIILDTVGEHFHGGRILEVGAGDSDILIDVCRRFNPTECYGLDYVESACDRLALKAKQAGAPIKTICADMFSPPQELTRKFDFVMSFGVVEHFHDLPEVLRAIGNFATSGGVVFTLIPNHKKTIYGFLMRRWNLNVYNAHVMYDAQDLEAAHRQAGLEIIWNGHLVSSNFGMLSWCFKEGGAGLKYWFFKQLTRLSKVVWLVESRIGLLKPSPALAPYIICVARVVR